MAKQCLMNAKFVPMLINKHLRFYCQHAVKKTINTIDTKQPIIINKVSYQKDDWTNVSSKLLSYIGQNIHSKKYHPLQLVKQKVVNFFYSKFRNSCGNPIFSVYDNFSPVVTVEQNFDQILIPKDHPSRKKSDTYYINSNYVLRSQTSAHQNELIKAGLDNFLCIGDVYRKDEIDRHHFPVFHQVEAVKLFSENELFYDKQNHSDLKLFELNDTRTKEKQETHTLEAVKLIEHSLKSCLVELFQNIFGRDLKYRWVDCYFPFTHPSFELELYLNGDWIEILGCGIIEQQILKNTGVENKIGWAFGIGLERVAMRLYEIPDIRLFWSNDSGFLSQFEGADINKSIKYKPVSVYPQCTNDISFWISDNFSSNDFYEMVRHVGGDMIEQVKIFDQFYHPKRRRSSHSYRIVYRSMNRNLTQKEVNLLHKKIEQIATREFEVEIR